MKTLKFNTLFLMIATLLMSFSLDANAQRPNKGQGQGQGMYQQNRQGMRCNIPDLTEAQQKKIAEMRVGQMKDMLMFRNSMAEKKARLNTLRTADKADMNAINKTIDEMGAIKTQMMKKREAHRQAVRQILTDEQRVIFDSRPMHGPKGGMMMGGHGKGKGQGQGQGMGMGMKGQRGNCPRF